ncbi:MAG: ComEC/Rec2 family competence protein [Chloroflexi bacterium]|nr:ComEC/Rec2 family competence protein [Chloroflexota bacterium]
MRAPLVAVALVSVACALARSLHPLGAIAVSVAIGLGSLALALLSADRPRRLLWGSASAIALASAVRGLVPVPPLPWAEVSALDGLRAALAAPLRDLVPEPESGILLGIVLGERASIARELRDAFAASGTTHLLAISGFNMTLVAGAAALALRGRARPAVVAPAGVACVILYSLLVGLSPSVVRAALMAAVGAIGIAVGRRTLALNALGGAGAAMLLADPGALEDVGFLLSVAATGGLILWQSRLAAALGRLPRPVAEALAATCAASAPTLPIVAAAFGRVSLVSPLSNLVAVPLFVPVMTFGAATAAVGAAVPAAAWPLALAAYVSATALRRVVEVSAALPLASLDVPRGLGTGVVVAALLAAVFFAGAKAPRVAPRIAMEEIALRLRSAAPRIAIGLAVAVAIGAVLVAPALARSPALRVRALDVGQGDAFLVESRGRFALIDGGPDPARLMSRLGEALAPWQRRIDVVALTHEHADHALGLSAVLDRYEVGLAIEPLAITDVVVTQVWHDHAARARVPVRSLGAGARIRFGEAVIDVLAPGRDRALAVPDLVLRISSGNSSILFMGDATDDVIADLLLDPAALRARAYVPPHHGAATPYGGALAAAVRPDLAVISVGAGNRYGHPTPETLSALAGIATYRTDRHGTVEIEFDGARPSIRTAKAGVPPDRGGPVPRAAPSR